MQAVGDGGELVGAAWVLVRALAMEPQTLDFPVTNCEYATITGTDAYAASPSELNKLDKNTCEFLRVFSKGRAYDSSATESHGRSWTNAQLQHKWRVVPTRAEIAIRRIKWWQAMTEHNSAHLQTMAAIWGQLPGEAQTLTAEGSLSPTVRPFAVAFSEDLHLFAGLSGTEGFLRIM